MSFPPLLAALLLLLFSSLTTATPGSCSSNNGTLTLGSVRDALVRQEDTVVFALIERAKFPLNSPTYDEAFGSSIHGFFGSLVRFVVRDTEVVQAKAGRYESLEEVPFFPDHLPPSMVKYPCPVVLYPAGASINFNKDIWEMYFEQLLPLFVRAGDDGNYAATAANDLVLLQVLSRRIHYGRYVAEAKFRDATQDYEPLIRAKDRDALMELLTDKEVEETVKKRVEKKATVFGQNVSLQEGNTTIESEYKIDPSVAARLYEEWLIPLTKRVEVEYLLHRLD